MTFLAVFFDAVDLVFVVDFLLAVFDLTLELFFFASAEDLVLLAFLEVVLLFSVAFDLVLLVVALLAAFLDVAVFFDFPGNARQ